MTSNAGLRPGRSRCPERGPILPQHPTLAFRSLTPQARVFTQREVVGALQWISDLPRSLRAMVSSSAFSSPGPISRRRPKADSLSFVHPAVVMGGFLSWISMTFGESSCSRSTSRLFHLSFVSRFVRSFPLSLVSRLLGSLLARFMVIVNADKVQGRGRGSELANGDQRRHGAFCRVFIS